MALPPGMRLGVYEVTAQIGAGGMGEVYRATDTKLKREVAIKILPPSVAADHDRLARFQREAEVLASLNHPHIAAIYGLEESDGVVALVMELVEGEDLSQRIARGAIPIDEALPIAKQIAEALEAAHEQGIIHRDLKPANVKVREDGTVKVLDFGLAKAMDPAGASSASAANSPTLSMSATQAGIILGTAAYMSPEQASGKRVDKRADIWSFGVVLLEMLTGRRLFDGETTSHTLADVLRGPIEFNRLPAHTPRAIRDLLRRCLNRDVKKRLRDVGEARIAIEDTLGGGVSEEPAAPRSIVARVLPWSVVAILFVALGVALWAPWRLEKPIDRPLVRLDVDLGEDAAFPAAINTGGSTMAISPDGSRLVYLSGSPPRLFTRRLDQPKATELPGTRGAVFPFFSPDGQWVGFGANGKLNKISVDGGAVVQLGEAALSGATWAEDGSIFVSEFFGRGLMRFPADGSSPKTIVPNVAGQAGFVIPRLLPGGNALVSASCTLGSADNCNIEVLTLADGRRRTLARGGHSPHYVPSSNGSGHLVYINGATLFAIPFVLATLETRGTAVPVVDDLGFAQGTGAGLFDVSRTGTLIYRRSRGVVASLTTVQWVDPAGKKAPLRTKPAAYSGLRLSPDGTLIALAVTEGASQDIWVFDPRRDAMTRLTFGGINRAPLWSPDGQFVVFVRFGQGMMQARADGSSQPQPLTTGATYAQVPWSFAPDGKRLAYFEAATVQTQIWTVPLEVQSGQLSAGKPERFLTSNFADQLPSFSPDGRWLAYQSNESGRNEVYVRAFPPSSSGQRGRWQISNNGGGDPTWSRAGRELVYRSPDHLMIVSYSVQGDTFIAEKPREWIAAAGINGWSLAPDGKRIAAVIAEATAQAPQQEHEIVMLFNFADELRRRVPLGK